MRDELSGADYSWRTGRNYVKLAPGQAHVMAIELDSGKGATCLVSSRTQPARCRRGRRDQGSRRCARSSETQWFERQPLWFKTAVFYEIHTRAFFDSSDDGSGDFRGLAQKLDYLQWLGIDCIWLLPFYPSPLRDGGYDIAQFKDVHPDYGTLDDFRTFVEQAHERGMRVIADLVMNHTSSDHPWFQESRSSPDSPKRDWYVWGDDPTRYAGRPDHLRRLRDLELDVGPGRRASTTGTASSTTSPT